MGFKTGDFPPVDMETFLDRPLQERLKALALHWVEYGFGSPRMIHTIYVLKLLFLSILGGLALATWTSGAGPFWDVTGWWNEPVVYQKLVLWTVFLEAVGVAASCSGRGRARSGYGRGSGCRSRTGTAAPWATCSSTSRSWRPC
jgi:hypothetical protein